jgi:hypothetical protein
VSKASTFVNLQAGPRRRHDVFVRIGHPLLSHVRLASDLAAMPWGGLMLRDARLRVFLPFAKPHQRSPDFNPLRLECHSLPSGKPGAWRHAPGLALTAEAA